MHTRGRFTDCMVHKHEEVWWRGVWWRVGLVLGVALNSGLPWQGILGLWRKSPQTRLGRGSWWPPGLEVRTGGWRVKKRSKFSASRPHCRRERRTREACNGWGDDEHGHKRQEQKVKERTNKSMRMDVNVRGVTGTAGYWIAILDTYPVKQTSIMNVPTRLLCLPPKNEKSVII